MSLPACQQHVLNEMESALQASEPHLVSMFAIFARLNQEEPVRAEPLLRRRGLRPGTSLYALVLVPLMFATIVGALLGGSAHRATTCGPAAKPGTSYKARPLSGAACLTPADAAFRKGTPQGSAALAASTASTASTARKRTAAPSCRPAPNARSAALTATGHAPPGTAYSCYK